MCGNHPSNKGGMSTVISQIREFDWNKNGVELRFIPTYMPGGRLVTILYFIRSFFYLCICFLFKRPDVLYTHMSVRGSFNRTRALHKLCKIFKVKDVIHLHGSEFADWFNTSPPIKQKEICRLIEEASVYIVLGCKLEKLIKSIAPKANVSVLHNSVKIPAESVTWNANQVTFLYLGVLIPRKGVMDLLKAVRMIVEEGVQTKFRIVIAGTGSEEEKLKKYVSENMIDNCVEFAGWVSGEKKDELIRNSNVLVLPSYNEGLPMAVLEAMSFGLPIICTNVGDIEDAVIDGENGFLIRPGDIYNLADRIKALCDEARWRRMSQKSRSISKQQFDICVFYEGLKSIWTRCQFKYFFE